MASKALDGPTRCCNGVPRGEILGMWEEATPGVTMERTRRVTMREAADILGVSKEAVRKRVVRGTLPSDTGEDGRRYVYLDAGEDAPPTGERDALISRLEDEVRFLREELARKDAIMLRMAESLGRELEAPSEPPGGPTDDAGVASDTGVAPERETATSRERPWWRRVFG